MSTRSTSLPPSISKKSAPPQQDNGAQRKISGPANSVDQDPQDEVEGDDEEEMDLIEYSDEEDHQSSNKTPRQLDEEEMRRRVQTQWGCTPEEVIPTKLLEPKRHGEKLINSWLSFLCQIQTLGVDLKLARDEIENACDQNTVKYVGIEELEYAVVLAKEKRDAVTELGSDDDARRSSETEGAGTGILSRVRWDQEELDGDNDQSIDAPAQDGDSPAASDNDDPPKIDNRRLSKMKPKPKTNRTTMPSVSVGKKTKIDGVRPGDIEAGTSSEPPQAKDGEGQVDKNRVKTTEDRKRPSGDRELPGQSPKKISKKGQGKEATGGAGGGAGGPQPPAKKATQGQ